MGGLGAAAATPAILARLAKLLADEEEDVRWAAAWAVGRLGAAAVTPAILAGLAALPLDEDDQDVLWAARKTVAILRGAAAATPAILARLAKLLADEEEDVRSATTQFVGGLGAAAATPAILAGLAELLADKEEDVREAARGGHGCAGCGGRHAGVPNPPGRAADG